MNFKDYYPGPVVHNKEESCIESSVDRSCHFAIMLEQETLLDQYHIESLIQYAIDRINGENVYWSLGGFEYDGDYIIYRSHDHPLVYYRFLEIKGWDNLTESHNLTSKDAVDVQEDYVMHVYKSLCEGLIEITDEDRVISTYCTKYNINPEIPRAYINCYRSTGRFYLDIPCGTGKTIGLAIALKACPEMSIVYIASTHSRLREFVNTLLYLDVKYGYIHTSRVQDSEHPEHILLSRSRVLVMTNCMYSLIDKNCFQGWYHKKNLHARLLVIDELPKFLLPIWFESREIINFFATHHFTNKQSLNAAISLIEHDKLCFDFNEFLSYTSRSRTLMPKHVNRVRQIIQNVFPTDEEIDNKVSYLSIPEVYTKLMNNSVILDATSDLCQELLDAKPIDICDIKKDYADYIDYCSYTHISEGFQQRDDIIANLSSILDSELERIFSFKGPYYLVTHRSSIYDTTNEDSIIMLDDISEQFKSKFAQVYQDSNRDYILCRKSDVPIEVDDFGRVNIQDDDLFISNYGRSRGSNAFRDCRTVVLLGTFYLPENELKKALSHLGSSTDPKDLQIRLSIADGVQEISRGCLRKRDKNNKMSILMYGDQEVLLGISKYLGITNIEKYD